MTAVMESKRIVFVDKILLYYRGNEGRNTLSTARNNKQNYVLEAFNNI